MNHFCRSIGQYLQVAVLVGGALSIAGCSNLDPTLGGMLKIQSAGDAPKVGATASTTPVSVPAGVVSVPDGAPGTSNAAWPAARGCRMMTDFTTHADVDTLYARAMKSFNFKSPDQIAVIRKTVDRLYVVDDGYKHEKQAGAYYHLAQSVNYVRASGMSDAMWLDLEFSKNGAGADVSAKYCTTSRDPQVGTVSFHQSVQKLIRDSLGK
ncbi:MAG: hypothetical protein EKK47_20180 [Burkholderiales bacterium]|nr:MAG: hypothetical protein EKK47_20180 [Burkholderiales bacterium]